MIATGSPFFVFLRIRGVGLPQLTVERLTGVQLLSFFRSLQCTSTI
jgi:hypothetical protein